jgi:acetylornithine/N-succinyldiaminopimelate aminotransferase
MTAYTRATFDQVMVPNYAPGAFVPVSGKGSRLKDQDGREYIDFAGGIAVSAVGHAHPRAVKALVEQAGKLWHVANVLTNEPALRLASRLVEKTFAERVFLCNSGAEANEAALKLARKVASDAETRNGKRPRVARRHEIVAFDNAFHGRTLFTVTAGGQAKYTEGFGPLPGGIRHVPFNDLEAARAVIGPRTCAVIVEPVQGEGGVMPAKRAFLKGLRELCDRAGALLVFDEVQSGAGRSGTLYAYQQLGVTPDILTSAKGLGGGIPIGAMLTTAKIAAHFGVGAHGSTYGGNPLASAVAAEVLDIVSARTTLEGVRKRHAAFVAGLEAINRRHAVFREIRGMGLLLGCELAAPWKGRAKDLMRLAEQRGLLVLQAGPDVIRLAPSLLIPMADVKAGLKRLASAAAELAAGPAAQAA